MNKRTLLFGAGSASLLLLAASSLSRFGIRSDAAAASFPLVRTEAEWRSMLSDMQFSVLREEATERAGTSPLNQEERTGLFQCAGCDLPVYSSQHKYESGTGWPSFWQSLPDAVGTKTDSSLFVTRIEVHCIRCGGHFGHIFDDGPVPTGKRHCLNGVALNFIPQTA